MPNTRTSFPDVSQLLQQYQERGTADNQEEVTVSEINLRQEPRQEERNQEMVAQPVQLTPRWRPSGVVVQDNTQTALNAGFGTSRYDSDFYQGKDVETSRALSQSNFSKIGTGLLKGGVTAATTAVETTLGTVFGLGSALFELAADANGNGRSAGDTLDAGVNNWLAQQLNKIQQWSEEQFPNYRTATERSEEYQRQWYLPSHFFSANNIGDNILKNFGFTVGALAGGVAWSRLIGLGLSKKLAGDIMKGAVVAAEGDSEVSALLRTAAEAVQRGSATEAQTALARAGEAVARGTAAGIDASAIKANVENAARALTKYGAKLQIYGGAVGAMGEGTVEGIMASKEFHDDFDSKLQNNYERKYNQIEEDVLYSDNLDWYRLRTVQEPDGRISSVRVLSEQGQAEVDRRRQELTDDFRRQQDKADQEGDRLSSTTFLLNLPILIATNAIEFGKLLSGGWKTSKALSGLTGGISTEGGQLVANYAAKNSKAIKSVLGSVKVAGTESFEEMAQGTISSGAKQVATKHLADFNNDGYDEEATDSVRDWFVQMYTGGSEYLSDIKNWQEGAIGGLTGLFGIPGKRWGGGAVGAIQDAREEYDSAVSAAENLNRLVNSEEFQNKWHGYIRHLKYDTEMNDALAKDDEYAWHNAEDKQLINDIITFADAGRLEDLNQIVSHYADLSDSDAQSIREAVGEEGWVKNLSDAEIVGKVKEQAQKMKDTISEYKDVYSALSAIAPKGTKPEHIKEMVFTSMQINAFDKRFLELFGETMLTIDKALPTINRDASGRFIKKEEAQARLAEVKSMIENTLANNVLAPMLPADIEKFLSDTYDQAIKDILSGDEQAQKKYQDMMRLAASRRAFYTKLRTLQNITPQQYEEQAITPEDVQEEAEKAFAHEETKGLNSLNDVKQAYFEKTHLRDKDAFVEVLRNSADDNPYVKTFLDIKKRYDGLKAYQETHSVTPKVTVTSNMVNSLITDALHKARSEQEFEDMPDEIFSTYEGFSAEHATPWGSPSREQYESAKDVVRQLMRGYLGLDTSTPAREAVDPNNTAAEPEAGTTSTPQGYDAAQPSSVEQAPALVPQEQEPEEEEQSEGQEPEQEEVQQVEVMTQEDVVTDAEQGLETDTVTEEVEEERQSIGHSKAKIAYLRTSVPEILTSEAKKLREAYKKYRKLGKGYKETLIKSLREADLSDFVKSHPEYATIWNALAQRGAFENVASRLNVGDKIEFVVDPTFPTYNGQYQILLTTVKDGERLVLNVLSQQENEYLGLDSLRSRINKEYQEFIKNHPNELFVFSKASTVWAKRPGFIEYDFDTGDNRSIVDIPGYNRHAPIVYFNRNDEAKVVRGDQNAEKKVSKTFNNSKRIHDAQLRGALYYLAEAPNGNYRYIPIRITPEQFNQRTKNDDNETFRKVREISDNITKIVQETSEENIEEQNAKLRKQLEQLGQQLDIHRDYFELGVYENVGVALRYLGTDKEKGWMRRPDQITEHGMVNFIADLGRAVQLHEEGETINPARLRELINQGLIKSNARMLRQKGVDFYMDPWVEKIGDFGPVTDAQRDAKERREASSQKTSESNDSWLDDGQSADVDYEGASQETGVSDNNRQAVNLTGSIEDLVEKDFAELPEDIKDYLKAKGYTEEMYNNLSDMERRKKLNCIGA